MNHSKDLYKKCIKYILILTLLNINQLFFFLLLWWYMVLLSHSIIFKYRFYLGGGLEISASIIHTLLTQKLGLENCKYIQLVAQL